MLKIDGEQIIMDIDSLMLTALVSEGETSPDPAKETVSFEEQVRYLKRHVNLVSVDDRKSIGNVLVMNNKKEHLRPCAEGTVINLDAISPAIVEQMYDLLSYKMIKRT